MGCKSLLKSLLDIYNPLPSSPLTRDNLKVVCGEFKSLEICFPLTFIILQSVLRRLRKRRGRGAFSYLLQRPGGVENARLPGRRLQEKDQVCKLYLRLGDFCEVLVSMGTVAFLPDKYVQCNY